MLKWSSIQKRLLEADLFDRTRRTLTLQYSGMLILFLSLFVLIVYSLLYLFIWNDQYHRLNELANSEIDTLQRWADKESDPYRRPPREIEDAFSISSDQSFYYWIAENRSLQLGDEIQPELRPQVMDHIAQGRVKGKGIHKIALQTVVKPSAGVEERQVEQARFIVAVRDLTKKGERIGTLYVGKEVTFQHDLFRWLLLLLIGLALLFFLLALWFSHRMARRAIVPIAQTYTKQREFVADASHELRTPLSVLLSSIEALQLEEALEREPFARQMLYGMKEEVRSITKLAAGLLQLARSDSGELVLNRSRFSLNDVAAEVIRKLQPLAQSKDITVRLHASGAIEADWDADKMNQLLVLLIDNAIKYTPDRGDVDVRLDESAEKGTRWLTVEVQDSGIGIEPEALSRIFDRFYRQDKSRTRQEGGHGLGLSIAKSLVEAGRGTIHVDSKVGTGSTFRVRLPM